MLPTVKEGVRELIFNYFGYDVLVNHRVQHDLLKNIIETFTYAYNRHQNIEDIEKDLEWTEIWELRQRRINLKESNYKPFPIRLGDLKPILQMEAAEHKKTLHGHILNLLMERQKIQKNYIDVYCVPRLSKMYRYKRLHNRVIVNQLELFN